MDSSYVAWLQATPISKAIQQSAWIWPLCETLHFIGLSLLIGVAGLFDLRLLGLMKRVPLTAIMEFMPWAIVGFSVNLVTGAIFFVGRPDLYVGNIAWWGKLFFLLVAGLNAMVFQTTFGRRVRTLKSNQNLPWTFKVVGGLSLVAWFGVLYFGRMLPYFRAQTQ